ncbi:MAG: HesA/MoeB/ThiF family protein [Acidimicrobiales bacterium]
MDIVDPLGQAWALLEFLDGTRPYAEVIAAMLSAFPTLTAPDVAVGIARLDAAGLLDDASPCRFDTDPQLRRYVGNVNYFSHFCHATDRRGDHQEKLSQSTATLLGLGGGGSTIIQLLAAIGIGAVVAVDHDRVDSTNLNRQLLFEEASVGRLKTEAARDLIARRNSVQEYRFVSAFVDSPSCVSKLIAGSTRGRVFSVIPRRSGCIDCLWLHYAGMDPRWASRFRAFNSMQFRPPTLAFAPNLMRLCAEIVDEVVRILTNYLPPRSIGTQLEVDFETGVTTSFLDWPRAEGCPTCGDGCEEDLAKLLGSPVLREP